MKGDGLGEKFGRPLRKATHELGGEQAGARAKLSQSINAEKGLTGAGMLFAKADPIKRHEGKREIKRRMI